VAIGAGGCAEQATPEYFLHDAYRDSPESLRLAAVWRVFWELGRASRSVFLMRCQLRMTLRWRSWTAASTPGRSASCPWQTPRPISRSTGRPGLRVGVRGA
jgi:hypothetical protein